MITYLYAGLQYSSECSACECRSFQTCTSECWADILYYSVSLGPRGQECFISMCSSTHRLRMEQSHSTGETLSLAEVLALGEK